MELRRRLDPKVIFVGLYLVALAIYIIVGLQPADAARGEASGKLTIPSVSLDTDVTALEPNGRELDTPDYIVGSYSQAENKTLLIGHSTTAFTNLSQVKLGDEVDYNGTTYRVVMIDKMRKTDVNMYQILAGADKDTIIMMTCAGQLLGGGDATHRLMVTAVAN